MELILTALHAISLLSAPCSDEADRWRGHLEDLEVQEAWVGLSSAWPVRPFALEHVTVVDVRAGRLLADRTVRVRDGSIAWVGPATEARPAPDEQRIDASGKFLMPGLVDMHVHHLTSASHPLLEIACGVTTARDMCGFPWLLEWRTRLRDGRLLGPDLFVAGHILNAFPMEFYATVVRTPDEAREAVRRQFEAGYDFIKVHNNLPLEVYRAICGEAREAGIPVVGHVPQGITLAEAIAQGHSTLEHFKGYILDRTLELTTEDYVAITREKRPWLCPTLATCRIGLTGDEAVRFVREAPGMRYVSVYERERWLAAARTDPVENPHRRVQELSAVIFRALLPVQPRYLTGTDSGGGYARMLPGFSLLDELELMEGLGLPTAEVLRAATLNPAEALGQAGRRGEVAVGQRADLLLLEADPLKGAVNVRRNVGVAVHGRWLDRAALDRILATIEGIMAHGGQAKPLEVPDAETIEPTLARQRALHEVGFPFMDHQLDDMADLLRTMDRAEDAARVLAMRTGSPEGG